MGSGNYATPHYFCEAAMRVLVCGGRGTANMVKQAKGVGVKVIEITGVKNG